MKVPPRYNIEDDNLDLLWHFTAYIKQVVKNARLEYLRKLEYRVMESPIDQLLAELFSCDDPLPVSKTEFDFESDKLSQAFDELNLLRQRILTLIFVECLSAQETADRLNCSVDYVYLQKHRILKKLRDQLMNGGDANGK